MNVIHVLVYRIHTYKYVYMLCFINHIIHTSLLLFATQNPPIYNAIKDKSSVLQRLHTPNHPVTNTL